ncbi:BTB/POZ protein [Geopyxis carbonaria]|nr:BTB/POZ protein [Geopyxis carbonaria]
MTTPETKLAFFDHLKKLFNDPTRSDLTIKAGTAVFHVHQCLLSVRTSFFDKAIDGGFEEAKDKTITINEHSAHAVERFLTWCYSGDYTADSNTLSLGEGISVYFLADMLGVDELKVLAGKKFRTHLQSKWVANDFTALVEEIYEKTPANDLELRNVVVDIAQTHQGELVKISEYRKILTTYGEFSGALVLKTGNSIPSKSCPNCARPGGLIQYHCTNYCRNAYPVKLD